MKQILQNLKNGKTEVFDVPCPGLKPGHLLIKSRVSLVSAGTERMLVDFGKAGWIEKVRQQPDKVQQVIYKVQTDGLMPTIDAVRSKLDQPLIPGYCNVGVVIDGQAGIKTGDRVVSNGAHAEVVCVPRNLCAKIPDAVSDDEAAFTVLGAIALQGVRLIQPTLGESFAVIGLGLIGLLAVQILKANGCRVLGIDLDQAKCDLAEQFGSETINIFKGGDPVAAGVAFSGQAGVDGVLITASTKSSEPVHQAALMCRKRGRIVLVGVTGLELSRDDFYKKELSFQVSCSYGPGRYDAEYEEKGHDYPLGYVRWTEQRNFEAILQLMAEGKLNVGPLISHRFPVAEAEKAYALLGSREPYLGILLEYGRGDSGEVYVGERTVQLAGGTPEKHWIPPYRGTGQAACQARNDQGQGRAVVGFIGAGNYAGRVLMPAFQKAGVVLKTVGAVGGVSAVHYGRKFGFQEATTDIDRLFADAEINLVVIATPHNSHARFVVEALRAGKHVFVEKPLCLNLTELAEIRAAYEAVTNSHLMVGFNRRFAPQVQKMKSLLSATKEPKNFIMTVNAGMIPPEHWTQDPQVGGGRIIGEACHFVDLLRFLAGAAISEARSFYLGGDSLRDKVTLQLAFADGSVGSIHYLANGHNAFPKERLEVFCGGRVLQLDNFRRLRGYGWPGFSSMNLWRQDKGQEAEVKAFVEVVREGKEAPIPFDEILEVSRVTIEMSGNNPV